MHTYMEIAVYVYICIYMQNYMIYIYLCWYSG